MTTVEHVLGDPVHSRTGTRPFLRTVQSLQWAPEQVVTIPLMCISAAVSLIVAFWLLEARGIIQLDVWFHLDTDDFLVPTEFSELIRHPNLGLFVRRPVLLATGALGWLGIGADAPLQLFYWAMLLVAPVAAALRTLAAYRSLCRITNSVPLAVVLCLLDISAFATIAIGSVPESYPLTAACLAALYWLLATDARAASMRWGRWIAIGTLAVGITVTNIMPFAILLASGLLIRGVRLPRVLALTSASLLAVAGTTIALVLASAIAIGEPLGDRVDPSTEKFMRDAVFADTAREVAWAMALTFIAPRAEAVPGSHTKSDNPDHDYILLLPAEPMGGVWWRALLPAVAMGLGLAGFLRQKATALWALPAVSVILGNFGLHLLFGHHFFMYAMHWTFSMVWLMSGVAFLPGRWRVAGAAALAVMLVVTAANSALVIQQLVVQLRAA